jgi:hypothetical protein
LGEPDPSVCPHPTPPNPWALPDYVPPVTDGIGPTRQGPVTDKLIERIKAEARGWGSPPQPGPEELAAWAKAHEPLDISHEEARTYFYPDPDEGFIQVEVEAPVSLRVEDGQHLIVDADGIGVILAGGWSHIEVFPKQP